jgi:drug/metabolite transporter (DMT)-like permease
MAPFLRLIPMAQSLASQRALPYVLLLISAASWGGNWAAARLVHLDVPPFAMTFWRWFLAAVILLPFAWGQLREDAPLIRRHAWSLAGFGIVGTAAFTMFGYWGVRYTSAINATLLNASLPLFIVPLSWLLLKLTVSGRQMAGLAFSLVGVLCILSAGEVGTLAQLSLNPGDFLVLAGALCWALYTVALKWRPPIKPLSFLFMTLVFGSLFTVPFYAWEISAGYELVVNAKTLTILTYLALFPSVIAYICWNRAVPLVGPNVAGFFNPLIPVFGTLFAFVLLGEQLHPYHLAGFALVLIGVFLTSKR